MCRIELLRGTANLACPCVIAVSAVQETVEKVQEEQQNCKTAESRCGGTQAVVRWECLYLFSCLFAGFVIQVKSLLAATPEGRDEFFREAI